MFTPRECSPSWARNAMQGDKEPLPWIVWLPPPGGGRAASMRHVVSDEPFNAHELAGHGPAAPPLPAFNLERVTRRYRIESLDAEAVLAMPAWWLNRVV